ncbi:MAG: DUF4493 domain-containing protein [Bacteroidales bacterium]
MKGHVLLPVCGLLLALVSCKKDEPLPPKETGAVLLQVGLDLKVTEQSSALKAVPVLDDFQVNLYRSDGTLVQSFARLSLLPDTLHLETGDYRVEAFSDNDVPADFDNPYYYGISDAFQVEAGSVQTVPLLCMLANTMVSVHYAQTVLDQFTDINTRVSSALGALDFGRGEDRIGYYRPLALEIAVTLSYPSGDGSPVEKTLSGTIPSPLANRHYEIRISATADEGNALFQIAMDDSEVPVEVISISDEGGQTPVGAIAYGDLLITEIMPNPAALADTEGEWFELFNATDHAIDLEGLILGRDEGDRHTIGESISLAAGAYLVLARASTATDAPSPYVYGSGILLPNAGAVLSVFNQGTEEAPGALIVSVDYGSEGFPTPTGASLGLAPGTLDPAQAALGANWCVATSAYSTGDLGTPGSGNDPCQ